MSDESRNTLCVSDQVPGFVGNYHLNKHVTRKHLLRLDLSLAVLDFYSVFRRYNNIENQILHSPALNQFLDIHFYLVLVT